MSEHLEACPFCGGSAIEETNGRGGYFVECHSPTCCVNPVTNLAHDKETAAYYWNNRA